MVPTACPTIFIITKSITGEVGLVGVPGCSEKFQVCYHKKPGYCLVGGVVHQLITIRHKKPVYLQLCAGTGDSSPDERRGKERRTKSVFEAV